MATGTPQRSPTGSGSPGRSDIDCPRFRVPVCTKTLTVGSGTSGHPWPQPPGTAAGTAGQPHGSCRGRGHDPGTFRDRVPQGACVRCGPGAAQSPAVVDGSAVGGDHIRTDRPRTRVDCGHLRSGCCSFRSHRNGRHEPGLPMAGHDVHCPGRGERLRSRSVSTTRSPCCWRHWSSSFWWQPRGDCYDTGTAEHRMSAVSCTRMHENADSRIRSAVTAGSDADRLRQIPVVTVDQHRTVDGCQFTQ